MVLLAVNVLRRDPGGHIRGILLGVSIAGLRGCEMKRWAWLLALPWAVSVDTGPCSGESGLYAWVSSLPYCGKIYISFNGKYELLCDGEDACQDLAAALNEAHERLHPTRTVTEIDGVYPCCEDKHTGIGCVQCDDHVQPQ
jgi:hypothetical protein